MEKPMNDDSRRDVEFVEQWIRQQLIDAVAREQAKIDRAMLMASTGHYADTPLAQVELALIEELERLYRLEAHE